MRVGIVLSIQKAGNAQVSRRHKVPNLTEMMVESHEVNMPRSIKLRYIIAVCEWLAAGWIDE